MPNTRTNSKAPAMKFDKKTMGRLFSYVWKYKLSLVATIICVLISAMAGVSWSVYIKTLVDDYISPMLLQANPDFSPLFKSILRMCLIYAVGIVATLVYNRIMVIISQNVLKKIRDDMFAHMQTLPIKYFDTHTHGDIMSHYTNDTDNLRQMISQSIPQLFSSVVTVIAVFFAMLFMSIPLTIFVLIFLFFALNVAKTVSKRSGKYFVKQQYSIGELNGYIEEMINGQKVVKVFCHEEKAQEEFDKKNEELFSNACEANKFANMLMPIMTNLNYLQYVLIAIVGGALVLSGFSSLTLGALGSFLQLSRSFTQPINQMSQQINSIVMALAGAQRIFKLIDEKSEEDKGTVTLVNAKFKGNELIESKERTGIWAWKEPIDNGKYKYTKLEGKVVFFDVDFAYEEDKQILHDISLYAKPGQKVAFVGATGAGKTTITNLINRFYDIADGKIEYDGISINKIKKPDLRRSLGIVLQDTSLFTGTVMENIRYGRLDASDEECKAAAKLANADSFISMLPLGYSTKISGNSAQLSQGQKQLISIARAAVADPPVMILDEATSSIDTRTEAIVQQGMDSLMTGRTVFVIAHRLSTVQNSNVIMVLELGRIIERGSHYQLINEKGKYYQLYTGAFELE